MSNLTEMTDASSAGHPPGNATVRPSDQPCRRGARLVARVQISRTDKSVEGLALPRRSAHRRRDPPSPDLTELAESLKNDALLKHTDPSIPYMDFNQTPIEMRLSISRPASPKEQADAQELKRLRRELRDVKDTSLWDCWWM